jgi:transposase-like protein
MESSKVIDLEAVCQRFSCEEECVSYLERVRWNGTPVCPYCGQSRSTPRRKELRHQCNRCQCTYSVTVQTVFHGTHVPLRKWFLAIALILAPGSNLSSRKLARLLCLNKNTALALMNRIEFALVDAEQRQLLWEVAKWYGSP